MFAPSTQLPRPLLRARAKNTDSQPVAKLTTLSRSDIMFAVFPGLFWLGTMFLEAPLRFYLARAGLPYAIYVRDGFLVIATIYCTIRFGLNRLVLLGIAGTVFAAVVGFLRGLPPEQISFGFKTIFPFFAGVSLAPVAARLTRISAFNIVILAMFVCQLGLIVLSSSVEFPWEGETYVVGGVSVEANRQWDAEGVSRVSGMCRSSVEAACLLGLFGIISSHIVKLPLTKLIVIAMGIGAVILTTCKGILLGWSVILVIAGFSSRAVMLGRRREYFRMGAAYSSLLVVSLAPLSCYELSRYLDDGASWGFLSLRSFGQRVTDVWPDALDRVLNTSVSLSGLGLGGIGTAQTYFDKPAYNPCDNAFVFGYCSFGVVGVAFLVFYTRSIALLGKRTDARSACLFELGLLVLLFGLTTNIFEAAASIFTMGLLMGWKSAPDDVSRSKTGDRRVTGIPRPLRFWARRLGSDPRPRSTLAARAKGI